MRLIICLDNQKICQVCFVKNILELMALLKVVSLGINLNNFLRL